MTAESERKAYAMHENRRIGLRFAKMTAMSEECIKREETSLNGL